MNHSDNPKITPSPGGTGLGQQDKGKDIGPACSTPAAAAPAKPAGRTSKSQLLDLEPCLDDLDWKILKTIRECRVILGQQLGRLYFYQVEGPRARVNATNRKLRALVDRGLIAAVNQKINVRLKGYTAYVYYLTDAGERILQIHLNEPEIRKRNIEPSMATLVHSVSVVECYVQTVEACRAEDMKLTELQLEPACWRPYERRFKKYMLKPDLAIVNEKREELPGFPEDRSSWYELRWFVEVDLNTENIQTLLMKCRRYYHYYKSDIEQALHDDVFPLVVWIVKTESRRETLIEYIRAAFQDYPRIFAVILPDEFTRLLRDEMSMEDCLCPM